MASNHYQRSYDPTRDVLRILEIAACIGLCIGLAYAGRGFMAGGLEYLDDLSLEVRLVLAAPGLAFSFFAFLVMCWVQVSRANIDTAEMTREMLRLARGGDSGAGQMTQDGDNPFTSGAPGPFSSEPAKGRSETGAERDNLKRAVVTKSGDKYVVAGRQFDSLSELRDFIIPTVGVVDYTEIMRRSRSKDGRIG